MPTRKHTRRLRIAFAVAAGALVLNAVLSLVLLGGTQRLDALLVEDRAAPLLAASDLESSILLLQSADRAYVISRDLRWLDGTRRLRAEVEQRIRTIRQASPPHIRPLADELARAQQAHADAVERLFARMARGEGSAVDDWQQLTRAPAQALDTSMQRLLAAEREAFGAQARQSAQVAATAGRLAALFAGISLLAAAGTVVLGKRSSGAIEQAAREREAAMERLRESEEQNRLVMEGLHDHAVMLLDARGHVLTWNDASERIQGLRRDQVIGRFYGVFFTPEDQAAGMPERYLAVVEREGVWSGEGWRIGPDGRRFRAEITLSALRAPDGSVRGFTRVVRDVSARHELEAKLLESADRLEFVQHAAEIGVWHWHPADDSVWISASLRDQLGEDARTMPATVAAFMERLHPDDVKPTAQALQAIRDGLAARYQREFRMRHRDGSWRWIQSRGDWFSEGERRFLIGVHIDVTALHEAREQALLDRERALVTLRSIGDGVIVTDDQGRVEQMNPIAQALTGWSETQARGRPVGEVFRLEDETSGEPMPDPVGACLAADRVQQGKANARLVARDGSTVPVEDSAAPIRTPDGRRLGAVLVFHDVTESRRLVNDIAWQASHDALTGLVNRREFEQRIRRLLDGHGDHALLYLDLDQFKIVNDSCGHPAGDELLRQLSREMQRHLRERDTLARLGGDEFAVILEHCPPGMAERVADELLRAVREHRFVWEGRTYHVGVSIGLVPLRSHQYTLEEVLRQADHACYVAKDSGKNRVVVHRAGEAGIVERQRELGIVSKLGAALREDRFELCYQPIVPVEPEPDGGEHWEILLRLRDEHGNLQSPGNFLQAAERYDLMPELDRRVAEKTLRILAGMPARLSGLKLCTINLSARTLGDGTYLAHVTRLLDETGVDPTKICFEITETAAIADLGRTQRFIEQLRARGCKFALDDFGTGMASFAYLKQLPVDYIKIDGSFISTIANSRVDSEMVRAINDVGHSMGKQTIAEFVCDADVMRVLRSIGVDYAQGNWISEPIMLTGQEA